MSTQRAFVATACLAGAALLFGSGPASSEDQLPSGNWTAKWTNAKGMPQEAQVTLAEGKGTWQHLTHGKASATDPCELKTQPVMVSQDGGSVTLHIARSQGLAGCTDSKVTLSEVTPTSMRGQFGNGREISFTKR